MVDEQAQPKKIFRARGTTATEKLLADLGDLAFLDLWSYPNLFYEKKQGGKGDGKELCDMLVVCGDDVIIFSDKNIKYQDDKAIEIAWPRFYRNAVEEAVKQINGANNWITRFPDKVFTDSGCTQKLPIEFPPLDKRRVHGVVVATGATTAVKTHHKDDSGSFLIIPRFKGRMAVDFAQPAFLPFAIGDANPDGLFIHVFDDLSIRRLLEHLDTISDFTAYLNARARYLRTDSLALAHGEEELLAMYLQTNMRNGGIPAFELPRPRKLKDHVRITAQGEWRAYLMSDSYFGKKMADEGSYLWDHLIKLFTENILAGTSVRVLDTDPDIALSERGVRFMALESRFFRRILSYGVRGLLRSAEEAKQDRYARVMLPTEGSATPRQAYVFMILAYPEELEKDGHLTGGYKQYRDARARMLEAYCFVLLSERRELDTAIGIALDARWTERGSQGGSEDLVVIHIDDWTDDLIADAAKAKETYDILRSDRLMVSDFHTTNYPDRHEKTPKLKHHRKQRGKRNPFRR
jgi:hypothetical protein